MSYAYLKTGSKIYMQLNVEFMIEDQSWNAILNAKPIIIFTSYIFWGLQPSLTQLDPPSKWSRMKLICEKCRYKMNKCEIKPYKRYDGTSFEIHKNVIRKGNIL